MLIAHWCYSQKVSIFHVFLKGLLWLQRRAWEDHRAAATARVGGNPRHQPSTRQNP